MSDMKFATKEPINKGWSSDKKYCVTDDNGTRYLLRISDRARYDTKQSEFNMMKQAAALGISMCEPIQFGTCDEGVYSIQSWIDGVDAEQSIPALPDMEQYAYGLEAGRILQKIHSIPAPDTQEDWEIRFNRKMDYKIQKYGECPIKYENGQAFIDYINENRHLLKGRPQVYHHGDYHIGNMMIDTAGKLYIIDFDRSDFGDPWEEFNRIVWSAQKAPLFASGMVNGYFGGEVPLEFWELLALYISSNTLSSVYWAIPFGQDEVNTMLNQAKEVLSWYDNMKNPVPTWYVNNAETHYNILIDENNDPVRDPKPLRDYMDKWDGQAFIDKMKLDKNKSVLEIGVGTGRLAIRTAPLCKEFAGIDISPKTIDRAKKNLAGCGKTDFICEDFLSYKFDCFFDVVYSSLTFMHIEDKQKAINKVAGLLNGAGRFVLSIDKNQNDYIDTGASKIKVYPDTPDATAGYIKAAGLTVLEQYDTEFATVFVAEKEQTHG